MNSRIPRLPEQHMLLIKTVAQWRDQVLDGMERIRAANGGSDPARFIDGKDVDFAAFASVVEALVALEPLTGRRVGDDLIRAALLVPVDQALQ